MSMNTKIGDACFTFLHGLFAIMLVYMLLIPAQAAFIGGTWWALITYPAIAATWLVGWVILRYTAAR